MGKSRNKKRRFQGNQHVVSKRGRLSQDSIQNPSTPCPVTHVQDEGSNKESQSASARKIGEISNTAGPTVNKNEASGYRFIDISIPC